MSFEQFKVEKKNLTFFMIGQALEKCISDSDHLFSELLERYIKFEGLYYFAHCMIVRKRFWRFTFLKTQPEHKKEKKTNNAAR